MKISHLLFLPSALQFPSPCVHPQCKECHANLGRTIISVHMIAIAGSSREAHQRNPARARRPQGRHFCDCAGPAPARRRARLSHPRGQAQRWSQVRLHVLRTVRHTQPSRVHAELSYLIEGVLGYLWSQLHLFLVVCSIRNIGFDSSLFCRGRCMVHC